VVSPARKARHEGLDQSRLNVRSWAGALAFAAGGSACSDYWLTHATP
jgi:hypothetical protein